MIFEIKPGVGVGGLFLGMIRDDTFDVMKSMSNTQPMLKSTFMYSKIFFEDSYRDYGEGDDIIIYYDQHKKVDCIKIGVKSFYKFILYGKCMKDWTLSDVKKEIKTRGFLLKKEENMYISDDAGFKFSLMGNKIHIVYIIPCFQEINNKYALYQAELALITDEERLEYQKRLKQQVDEMLSRGK